MTAILTERLQVRLPVEDDRTRFVELFCDADFMVFSGGVMNPDDAHQRFDGMLERAAELPFAKQPVIERSSGTILGYTGVNRFDFNGTDRLEWGYRLVPEARGKGYATEAGLALMEVARHSYEGEIIAMIDPRNDASKNAIAKLGFSYWKRDWVNGWLDDLYRITLP